MAPFKCSSYLCKKLLCAVHIRVKEYGRKAGPSRQGNCIWQCPYPVELGLGAGVNKKTVYLSFSGQTVSEPRQTFRQFQKYLFVIDSFGPNRCKKHVLKSFCNLDQRVFLYKIDLVFL